MIEPKRGRTTHLWHFLYGLQSLWWLCISFAKQTTATTILLISYKLMKSFLISILIIQVRIFAIFDPDFVNDLC